MAASPSLHPLTSAHAPSLTAPHSSSALPPADITLAGILTELSLCHHRTQQVQHQLVQLTAQHQQTTELILPTLASIKQTLPSILTASTSLQSILQTSALSASALSSQVRTLDLTQSRLLMSLQRVSALLDLKDTIASVQRQRETGALDAAVRELHRVLYLQRTIDDAQYGRLREMEEDVRNDVLRSLQQHQQKAEWKEAMHDARLLPYVDRTFAGLSAYCSAVRALLSATLSSKALTLQSQPPSSIVPFPQLLTSQLDHVAHTLKQQLQPVQHAFGPGSHLRLLQEISAECDAEMAPLLRQFVIDRKVGATVQQVRAAQQRAAALKKAGQPAPASAGGRPQSADASDVDVRVLDALLTEVAFLTRESDLFDAQMRTLARQAEETLQKAIESEEKAVQRLQQPQTDDHLTAAAAAASNPSSPSSSSPSSSSSSSPSSASATRLTMYYHLSALLPALAASPYTAHLPLTSALRDACQDLLGYYIALEEHYMLLNVDKAMRIDVHEGAEADEDDDDDKAEDDERRRREREGVSRVQAISDKFTQNLSSSVSNINLAIQSASGVGVPIQAAGEKGSAPVGVSPVFVRRFRVTLTSTLVDDVFFILKKCTERAFSTFSAQAACALVNHINALLQREYFEHLESVLVEYERKYTPVQKKPVFLPQGTESRASNLVALLTSAAQAGQLANVQTRKMQDDSRFLVTLNNLQVSVDHIAVLRAHLSGEFDEIRAGEAAAKGSAGKDDMMRACLDELSGTQQRFVALHGKGMQLLLNVLTVPLKPHLQAFLTASYELSEADYMNLEHSDVFVSALTDAITRTILPLRATLTDANCLHLLSAVLAYLCSKLEHVTYRKRFSVWGGLQMDRDVRGLSAFFSGVRGGEEVGVREKMTRLVQLCNVLQVEKVSEMKDLWGDGGEGGMWRLHEGEVRKVLGLRSDFAAKDIAALRL